MKFEYLVILDSESAFCKNTKAFNNFLQSNADIVIAGKKLKHKDFEINYELQHGANSNQNHKFFHIKLETAVEDIEQLSELLKAVRKLLFIATKNVQTLWDDLEFHYSRISYPLVYEIENLMRKLITKFMLTNVGLGWAKETIPDDLKKSYKPESFDNNNNYLYETDFIQLSNFLFDDYRTLDITTLVSKIEDLEKGIGHASDLNAFIPKSNWERYFRASVDCDGVYLKSR